MQNPTFNCSLLRKCLTSLKKKKKNEPEWEKKQKKTKTKRIQIVNFPSYVFTAHDQIYCYFFTFAIIVLKYCHPWGRLYKFFK